MLVHGSELGTVKPFSKLQQASKKIDKPLPAGLWSSFCSLPASLTLKISTCFPLTNLVPKNCKAPCSIIQIYRFTNHIMMTPEELESQEESHVASENKKTHKKKSHKKSAEKSKTHKKKTHAETHEDPPGIFDDIEMNHETVPVENDPFAPRDGKALLWRNVNMTLVRLVNCHMFCPAKY